MLRVRPRRRRVDRGGEAGMEDGLLCCLCSSSLPIRRISIAQFHPPITRMERQHAARRTTESGAFRTRKVRGGVRD